jgi:hypothetical protein
LSYRMSCASARYANDSLTSLRDLAYRFAQSSSTTMQSDKYALEIINLENYASNHVLAALVAETDGYGNDYKEFPFAPLIPLATTC